MTPAPEIGEVIGGKYEAVRLRGEGANGAVYEAQNVLTGRRVAIKWIRATRGTYEGLRERMLREAQSAARIQHRNVVDIYDVAFESGAIYLVMELLEGETLAAHLMAEQIPIATLLALLIPALRGIAAAHRSGVIHRDLKPENLFLARDPESAEPRCVVLDFGVAKLSGAFELTSPGRALGTPIYMPIEQLTGDGAVDARADVHAIGVILYVALTGRSPYEGATLREVATSMQSAEPVAIRQLRPELPLDLCLTVQRCVARDADARPASMDDLIAELTAYAELASPAWGSARGERTRLLPSDLGGARSSQAGGGSQQDDEDLQAGTLALRARSSSPPSRPTVDDIPRPRLDPRLWLLAAGLAVFLVVLVWPRSPSRSRPHAEPKPSAAAPRSAESTPARGSTQRLEDVPARLPTASAPPPEAPEAPRMAEAPQVLDAPVLRASTGPEEMAAPRPALSVGGGEPAPARVLMLPPKPNASEATSRVKAENAPAHQVPAAPRSEPAPQRSPVAPVIEPARASATKGVRRMTLTVDEFAIEE